MVGVINYYIFDLDLVINFQFLNRPLLDTYPYVFSFHDLDAGAGACPLG